MAPLSVTLAVGSMVFAVAGPPMQAQESAPQAGTAFFPSTVLNQGLRSWYGGHLAAMGELRLDSLTPTAVEAYRFLWLRTWGDPIAVRAWKLGSEVGLVVTELDGDGGYAPGHVRRRDSLSLTEADWAALVEGLDATGFWDTVPAWGRGRDGAEWVLEGVRAGAYRVVTRWSPGDDPIRAQYREVCLRFLTLARVDLTGQHIY